MSITKPYSAEDLLALGSDARFELIEGELREMSPSAFDSSEIGAHILVALHAFVYGQGLGRLSTENGGYILSRDPDTVVAPDIGFVRRDAAREGIPPEQFAQVAPDLAVEVMSPTDRFVALERKAHRYLAAGTRLVWIVNPRMRTIVAYAPSQPAREYSIGDELDGGDVLPGFRLLLADVFRISE
jgi:Uma2 family endonuclease